MTVGGVKFLTSSRGKPHRVWALIFDAMTPQSHWARMVRRGAVSHLSFLHHFLRHDYLHQENMEKT
jgi:hypothetical protein